MSVRNWAYRSTNPVGSTRIVSTPESFPSRPWVFFAVGLAVVACQVLQRQPDPEQLLEAVVPTPTVVPVVLAVTMGPSIPPASAIPAPSLLKKPDTNATDAMAVALTPTDKPSVILTPDVATISPQFPHEGDYVLVLKVDGLMKPVYLTHSGDDSGRLFVVEQGGRVLVLVDDQIISQPFLDISAQVSTSAAEQGLLSLAFHPDYTNNGVFFVHYSDQEGDTVVSSWKVSTDLNRADYDSEEVVLIQRQPYRNHNGGQIAFGPDGYLYIGLGDGGFAGDPSDNAQNLLTWLGTILRVDVDRSPGYELPPDNPFLFSETSSPEVWIYGLRNPWRFSFDRLTGDMYIGDVGQDDWEEIDFLASESAGGVNYGWNRMEGDHCYQKGCQPGAYVGPIAEYHQSSGGCSVTGGYVYRGRHDNGLIGVYLYGDYCSGAIWSLRQLAPGEWLNGLLVQSGLNISSFGEDQDGELYVVDHGGGIYWLKHVGVP